VTLEEDMTPWLVAAVSPILDEMFERLIVDLSEPDLSAVTTAVQKAAIAGVRQGVAVLASQRGGPAVTWSGPADYDDWAERFGQAE
jgi:hypothetical protein